MANFEAFRWNFLSNTNSEIGKSDTGPRTTTEKGFFFDSSKSLRSFLFTWTSVRHNKSLSGKKIDSQTILYCNYIGILMYFLSYLLYVIVVSLTLGELKGSSTMDYLKSTLIYITIRQYGSDSSSLRWISERSQIYMIGYRKEKIILKFPPFFRLNEENQ